MAKTIDIEYKGAKYELCFTREAVAFLERNGFDANDIVRKPITAVPLLFRGAFIAKHRDVDESTVDAIFTALPNKVSLVKKLLEAYNEPLETLLAEPEAEGNASWGAGW